MSDHGPKRELSLPQLIPNILTVGVLCSGLTAIRFAILDRFEIAIALIVLAALLDGLDGLAARALRSESKIGAELDSLSDMVSFGVAPGFILFAWAFEGTGTGGWIAVLVFAVCCEMRLARFNVSAKTDLGTETPHAFTGVPSPAGALLALSPIYVANMLGHDPYPPELVSAVLVVVGLLMISHLPTPSIKSARVYAENVRYYILGFVAFIACLLTWPWVTLSLGAASYLSAVAWSVFRARKEG